MATERGFRWICLLPVGVLVATELYVDGYDGWGAWAAAPLLLIPAFVSLPVVVSSFARLLRERRAGETGLATAGWTVVAGLPLLWLAVRRFAA